MTVRIPKVIVARTIAALQKGGAAGCEAVVLWLASGPRGAERIEEALLRMQRRSVVDGTDGRLSHAALSNLQAGP
jgi:hypothetical protein